MLDLINIILLSTEVKNIFEYSCIIAGLKLQMKEKYRKNNIYRCDNSGPLTIANPHSGSMKFLSRLPKIIDPVRAHAINTWWPIWKPRT